MNVILNFLNHKLIENLITKDYEHFLEFISQEDFFCDKLVNLQNPFFFLPISGRKNLIQDFKNKVSQYNKKKDVSKIKIKIK